MAVVPSYPFVSAADSMSYDRFTGNILTKSDLGANAAFAYGNTSKPHALTGVSNVSSSWGTNDMTISYTDFGKVQGITQTGATYSIGYLPDDNRGKTILTKGNHTQTRYYGDGTEKVYDSFGLLRKLAYLCHGAIVVNDEVIPAKNAVGPAESDDDDLADNSQGSLRGESGILSSPPSETILQGYYDAQGSLTALVSSTGTVLRRYAYDPWGNRLDPDDWTQPDTQADTYHINRGYTMHEHLGDFGLINMNGRVFDPLTAQFLSPDNYIQADGNWLNYNRYAYCLNNPLKYTDPSGEIILTTLTCAIDFVCSLGKSFLNVIDGDWKGLQQTWRDFDPSAPWSKTNKEWAIYKGLFVTDETQSMENRIGSLISRFTWESFQTAWGYVATTVRNIAGNVDGVYYYRGATFCINKVSPHCADTYRGYTWGNYINIRIKDNMSEGFDNRVRTDAMFMHEYGHYIQSQMLGPAYLLSVAPVSAITCKRNNSSHVWTETWANRLAADYFYNREGVDWEHDYFKHYNFKGKKETKRYIDLYPLH